MGLLALSGGLIMCVFDQAAFRNLGSRHSRAVMFLCAAWLGNTRTETVLDCTPRLTEVLARDTKLDRLGNKSSVMNCALSLKSSDIPQGSKEPRIREILATLRPFS
jgi:hypothetical protein